jgi:putative membrane protein
LADNTKDSQSNIPDKTTWSEAPFLIIKGFLMGSADIIPGVSGGTLALITGIYDRLIDAIKSVDFHSIKSLLQLKFRVLFQSVHWKFILLLFTGIALAIFFFTRVVPLQNYMFSHPEIVYGLFFGLILGSVFLLIDEIEPSKRGWTNTFPLLAGALFGFWIVTLVPADTPETFWFVLLSGSVAICAMILPGISGSYILLIFRKYDYILFQLGELGTIDTARALMNLLPFVIGAIAGLVLFSRVLSWLLHRYHAVTLLVLIGFLVGSLYVIWPYQEREFHESIRSVEVLPVSDPLVQELMERDEIPDKPEYRRIGEEISPDASFDEFKRVEVETVSRKLISSRPLLPWKAEESIREEISVWQGIAGIAGGLFMITGISYLRKQTE